MSKQTSTGALRKKLPFRQEVLEDKVGILIDRLEEVRNYHKLSANKAKDAHKTYYDTLTYLIDYFNRVDSVDEHVIRYFQDSLERDYGENESSIVKKFKILEQEPVWAAFREIILKSHVISDKDLLAKYIRNFKAQIRERSLEYVDEVNSLFSVLHRRCGENSDYNREKNPSLASYYDDAKFDLGN
jgi:hypothetical protein